MEKKRYRNEDPDDGWCKSVSPIDSQALPFLSDIFQDFLKKYQDQKSKWLMCTYNWRHASVDKIQAAIIILAKDPTILVVPDEHLSHGYSIPVKKIKGKIEKF